MADNFLEVHYQEYEAKKEAWLRKKKHLPRQRQRQINKPEDESL